MAPRRAAKLLAALLAIAGGACTREEPKAGTPRAERAEPGQRESATKGAQLERKPRARADDTNVRIHWIDGDPAFPASCVVDASGHVDYDAPRADSLRLARIPASQAQELIAAVKAMHPIQHPPKTPNSRSVKDEIALGGHASVGATVPRELVDAADLEEYDRIAGRLKSACLEATAKTVRIMHRCEDIGPLLADDLVADRDQIVDVRLSRKSRGEWRMMGGRVPFPSQLYRSIEPVLQRKPASEASLELDPRQLGALVGALAAYGAREHERVDRKTAGDALVMSFGVQILNCRAGGALVFDPKSPDFALVGPTIQLLAKAHAKAAGGLDPLAVLEGRAELAKATPEEAPALDRGQKLSLAPTFGAFIAAIPPLPAAAGKALARAGVKKALGKLLPAVTAFYPRSAPDLVAMKRDACSAKEQTAAEHVAEVYQQDQDHSARIGIDAAKLVKKVLAADPALASALGTTDSPEARYVAGRLIEARLIKAPFAQQDGISEELQYYAAAAKAGSLAAKVMLLKSYEWYAAASTTFDRKAWGKVLVSLAEKGSPEAAALAGQSYGSFGKQMPGAGDPRALARKWSCIGAKGGDVSALRVCGEALLKGTAGPVDVAKGLAMLQRAALAGDGYAAQVVQYHYDRKGDAKQAKRWLCVVHAVGR
jgi:hypothetical protein